jgi:anti-anti-sigma factor
MTSIAQYKLAGRLDGANAAVHEQTLRALLTGDVHSININMADLSYVSSAGLRVLLTTAKSAKARGGAVVLSSPQPAVLEVLKVSGFDTILDIKA